MTLRGVLLGAVLLLAPPLRAQDSALVTGTVTSATGGRPVRLAAVRVAGGRSSALSDDAGRYRLYAPLGEQRLEVRRIGFRFLTGVRVVVAPAGAQADITLQPLPVSLERVVVTEKDDAARRIIAAAIRRKQETRGLVHDYRYDGDVQLVVRDLTKSADSAASVVIITQTRTSAYWEQPNRYQETIVARRQTGNVAAEQNLIGVGQLLNFSRDRVPLGRFELASPVADDALERYDYRLLDTLVVDGRRVFRLSLEPHADGAPAFAGLIDIADSTFDVTGIDVGVNNAVRLGLVRNVRYQQRFGDVGASHWMPRSIELSFDLKAPLGMGEFGVRQEVELSGFRFDEGRRPPGLGEYRIVVSDSADRTDSATWARIRTAPLTPVEQGGWTRIDSIAHQPRTARQRVLGALFTVVGLATNPDFFHYNRVDGTYLGAGWTWISPAWAPGNVPTVKLGHAQASGLWQFRLGDQVRLSESRRTWVGFLARDETVYRPTLTSAGYNPTLRALFSTIDPHDYFRERALVATATTKLVNLVTVNAAFTDARQSSLPLAVFEPPFGRADRFNRANEPIADGRLRAFSGGITYDSRPLARQSGRDYRLGAPEWTRISGEGELSPGATTGSDFEYRRASVRVERRQQSFGWGITSLLATGGVGTRGMPAQRWFGIDAGARVLEQQASPFSTLGDTSLSVPRGALVSVQHDFDRLLFTRSGLPLVRDVPFTLAVRGSVFWTELDGAPRPGQLAVGAPYREAGFTLGNLTPFLAPFNLSARFAWQVSNYPTTPFRFSIGLGG